MAHLVNAVVSVAVFRTVFAVFASFGAAHDSHRFPSLPVFGLRAFLLIHRRVTVQSKCPTITIPYTQYINFSADAIQATWLQKILI